VNLLTLFKKGKEAANIPPSPVEEAPFTIKQDRYNCI
jgi:hypothetical protein